MRIRDNTWPIPESLVEDVVLFPDYPVHDCIWSMMRGKDEKLFFGLGSEGRGESVRLMEYDPETRRTVELADLATLTKDFLKPGKIPNSKIHFSLCVDHDGRIYGATHPTAPPPGEDLFEPFGTFADPDHGHKGGFVFCHDPSTGKTENLGLISPWEGIRTMIMDPDRRVLYGLTYPRVHIFSFELDTARVTDFGRVAMTGSFDLLMDAEGRVYGTDDAGRMYRLDPEAERIEDLPYRMPGFARRQSPYNFLWYPFPNPENDGWLYGGTYYDGHLFRFDPNGNGNAMEDLGYGWGEEPGPGVWAADYVQAPRFGPGQRIYYGFASIWETVHLVGLDLPTREKVDLGGISFDGLNSGFLSASAASLDGSRLYFADITMEGKARLLVVRPTQEAFEAARDRQANRDRGRKVAVEAPEIQEGFELQASEIMPVSKSFRESAFPFVEEGRVSIRELNFYGVSPGIPPDECAVKALTFGPDGRLYGATAGRRAHLFAYDPYPINDHVIDLGCIGEATGVCNTLVKHEGKIFGGTAPNGELFAYDPTDDYSIFWANRTGPIAMLGAPVPKDPILTLLTEVVDGSLYGLTAGGKLFAWKIETGDSEILAELDSHHLSPVLVAGRGRIFGAKRDGIIYSYDPSEKRLEGTGLKIPGGKGRAFQNEWRAAAKASDGTVYGGTSDGTLFAFDPAANSLTCMGRPTSDACIRTMGLVPDGRLYGIAGQHGRIGHLFCYDPDDRSMRDLGIPAVNFPKSWVGYEFDAMAVSKDGQVYLGESDRISHLFIHAPAMKMRKQ